MTTAITLAGITKRFGATTAVDDVSITIERGQLFFLLGPSGCGKTTLLRMIAGFTAPDAGSIRFGERDVTRLAPEKRNAGMVFQSYALWPHMTVRQNVEFGLRAKKVPREERRRRTLEALALVRMEQYADRKPGQLSGGQQQRISLARALAVAPDVLLLDEPLSNLDAKLRHEMRDEIRRVCASTGLTTVYVTHDQKEALSMADAMAVMRQGSIVQRGTPRQIYERPESRFVADFLGPTNYLRGTVTGRDNGAVTVRTEAGDIRAALHGAPPPDGEVTCLIRPESLQITPGEAGRNMLRGRLAETVYLGELAQHTVDISESVRVLCYELNPRTPRKAGEPVALSADESSVVLLGA